PVPQRVSTGKVEPYAAHTSAPVDDVDSPVGRLTSQWRKQQPNVAPPPPPPNQPIHTFFRHNSVQLNNNPNAPPHPNTPGQTLRTPCTGRPPLARQRVSRMELLQVSGSRPHELTQHFMPPAATTADAGQAGTVTLNPPGQPTQAPVKAPL